MTIDSHPQTPGQVVRSWPTRPLLSDQRCRHFAARITIKHWQLRDLLCVNPSVPSEALYPTDKTVNCLDMTTGKSRPIVALDFEPRCIQVGAGIVAAGGVAESGSAAHGQFGLFSVYNQATGQQLTHRLGDCINNSVVVFNETAGSSSVQAMVSNNDRTLYFLDVSGARIDVSSKIKLSANVNYSAISPDKNTVVCCGDSPYISICHQQEQRTAGRTAAWGMSKSFHSGADLGFSVAFHPSGMLFGAAFQNGSACLYDVRNYTSPLTRFDSTRPGESNGAFRCLKFSDNCDDLMFVSEQMERVHIIDLRDFGNQQVLTVPSASCSYTDDDTVAHPIVLPYDDVVRQPIPHGLRADGSAQQAEFGLSGMCWSPLDGGTLAVGTGSGVGLWKLDSLSRRTFPAYSIR